MECTPKHLGVTSGYVAGTPGAGLPARAQHSTCIPPEFLTAFSPCPLWSCPPLLEYVPPSALLPALERGENITRSNARGHCIASRAPRAMTSRRTRGTHSAPRFAHFHCAFLARSLRFACASLALRLPARAAEAGKTSVETCFALFDVEHSGGRRKCSAFLSSFLALNKCVVLSMYTN